MNRREVLSGGLALGLASNFSANIVKAGTENKLQEKYQNFLCIDGEFGSPLNNFSNVLLRDFYIGECVNKEGRMIGIDLEIGSLSSVMLEEIRNYRYNFSINVGFKNETIGCHSCRVSDYLFATNNRTPMSIRLILNFDELYIMRHAEHKEPSTVWKMNDKGFAVEMNEKEYFNQDIVISKN